MNLRTRTASLLGACALLCSSPGFSQTPLDVRRSLEIQVGSLLDSQRMQDRLWGAYYVGQYQLRGMRGRLLDLIETENHRDNDAVDWIKVAAFDALAQTTWPVPVGTLMARREQRGLESLFVVLSHEPGANREALWTLHSWVERDHPLWFATLHVLVSIRDTRSTKAVLESLSTQLAISIKEDESQPSCYDFTAFGGGGGGSSSPGRGYPPRAHYTFRDEPSVGAFVIVQEPLPLFCKRSWRPFLRERWTHPDGVTLAAKSRKLLAAALGEETVGPASMETLDLVWRDRAHYLEAVHAKLDEIRRVRAELVANLRAGGWLGEMSRVSFSRIELNINDARKDGEELPVIPREWR